MEVVKDIKESLKSEEQEVREKKHQMLLYMQHYIKEMKPQIEYQRVVTELAELRTREAKASVELQHYLLELNKKSTPNLVKITQDDLDKIPLLVEKGFIVGDEIDISKSPSTLVSPRTSNSL